MASYKETVIEESRKRAGEVLGQIRHLRRQVEGLEREYGEIQTVLKALGAENALGVQGLTAQRIIDWAEEVHVEAAGATHACSRKLMADILAMKEFRTNDVADLLGRSSRYAGRARGTLGQYAKFYIACLLKQESIVRMMRGKYAAVRKELPPAPEVKVRDDSGDDTEMRVVGGVVTLEEPEEKGYGRR